MLVNLLVQAGASVNCPDRRGNTSVHLAAQRKNVGILQILSQAENHSPNYNARNFGGNLICVLPQCTRYCYVSICLFCFLFVLLLAYYSVIVMRPMSSWGN